MAIPNQTISMHHVGDVIEDIAMSMRAEDFPHIASLLTNLYSNPIKAVEQEYATNAWDSHVSAGVTRPIEISLPTEDRLEFSVQDFGLGLSVDDLREVYSMYGRSLKRGTNDVAGQLGLGCKSGLTYAEMFTITAVKGGIKTVAVSTKDEHGVGVIKILDTLSTDEPNGVRITVPVERWDVSRFFNEAHELFQFWAPGTVLINGEAPPVPEWKESALRLDEHTWIVRKDAGLHSSYVTMGNVAYPVPDAQIGRTSRRFVADLNIGDVDFVPSREAVHYTRHTDATLAELTDHIGARFKHALDKSLAEVKTRWEETLIRNLWMDQTAQFRADMEYRIWTYNPHVSYGRKSQSHLNYRIHDLTRSPVVVVTDFPSKTISTAARDRLEEHSGRKSFVLLPKGIKGVGMLDGRPNTYTWEQILGSTTKPKGAKAARGPKVETRYAVLGTPGVSTMTADELAAVSGKVLYINPGETARYGTLDATVVSLYSSNQLPRVQRYVPGIIHYNDEATARRKAALEAITPRDKRIVAARTLPNMFSSLDPSKVADPDLAEAIRLSKEVDTATLAEAKRFGIQVSHRPLADFSVKYPLLSGHGYYSVSDKAIVAERLFYINAKYASLIEAEAALDTKAS